MDVPERHKEVQVFMQTSHDGSSGPSFGVTWGGPPRAAVRALTVAAAAAVLTGTVTAPAMAQAPQASTADPVSVIVRELAGAGDRPEKAVAALGGTVDRQLGIIGGFNASVPDDRLAALRASVGVASVTENAAVHLNNTDAADVQDHTGSMYRVTHDVTGATAMWEKGFIGDGIDVAVIDSGVVPVDGLRTPGKIVNGPDLSFEAQACETTCVDSPAKHLDTYGHGTHMAGIIAGRDDAASAETYMNPDTFIGMAPGSRVVSVKVADSTGATDVSQVIAAIDWVVQHRTTDGMNIRVLNLSFGTDGVQSYLLDPLTYAAEQAWHAGIVVVVAGGNAGYGTPKLNNPAYDPYVIAVGASDSRGTYAVQDDTVPAWSSKGDGNRNPDLVAPGASIISLRSPGSYLDQQHPTAREGDRLFRGSGTSQAAAVVSGAAALLLDQRPGLTPDQVKAILTGSAQRLPEANSVAQGAGMVDLLKARSMKTPRVTQTFPRATGLGSLEAARGTNTVSFGGVELTGEVDARGQAWNALPWSRAAAARTSWSGGSLSAGGWTGGNWNGTAWYPQSVKGTLPEGGLEGLSWSGLSWSGLSWSGLSWSGLSWSGLSWSGLSWSGLSWSGLSWSGISWS